MPTKLEDRLELLENALLVALGAGGGLIGGAELQRFFPSKAPRAGPVARVAGRAALGAAKKHPLLTAAAVAYAAHTAGLSVDTAAELMEREVQDIQEAQRFVSPALTPIPRAIIDPAGAIPRYKRKVSKANKAVKYGMSLLKAGSKKATGADKGKLPKGAFKMATKAAGLANPKTKSVIGKGKGKVKSLARKIRKWWK